ncbi:putative signaling protein [Acaryochloris thomasi RCC1774]|uniref:Putative signaling protein n=1 Tax=Acaryochloris thomasi RCC1774 TaxID=1764569 RepID=A0A2W1JPV5_9CYAN|nr:EAL domain-containing protein [Acaryochloris thomasi]PZD72922.1 putative signaling protein [Acaryochloris thomasi RCC1774]
MDEGEGHRVIELKASSYFVGRDPTNAIVLESKDVSRQHAIFLRLTSTNPNDYSFLLIDGNLQGTASSNGTKVNAEPCLSTRLGHGDQIRFGCQAKANYFILDPLTDQEFQDYCEGRGYEDLLTEVHNARGTIIIDHPQQPNFEAASLVRLASFPEIIPSPMFEVNLRGELTYLNPAAMQDFPNLHSLGLDHPVMQGLMALIKQSSHNILSREVEIAGKVFEQSIHYISESSLVRCCLFDVTQRKHAESELLKRDHLLQSVAKSTAHLLTNVDYETAISKALATFGEVAGVDRICVVENHLQAESLLASLRFEWRRDAVSSVRGTSHRQQQPYNNSYLQRWLPILANGGIIRDSVRALPELERQQLVQDDILSLMVVPIIVSGSFWGFIELDSCVEEHRWSAQEESIVSTLATSISAALQRQYKDEIIQLQAFHDALTGLPNRILFTDRLNLSLAEARRSQHSLAVMFMDLDRFKTINDTLGHSAGDALLQEVANRVKHCLRESDTVARWGGDEFTLLLPNIDHVEDATRTAQRILEAFREVIPLEGHDIYVNTSIGIAFYPADGKEAETLLKNADVALYQAKERGRGIYQLYNRVMNSEASEQFVLRNGLRHALDRQELLLHYQPQVDLLSGRFIGIEALLRWQHPEKGLIPPATFIPLAEETGLIIEIGEWVLRTACQQAVEWQQEGLQPLSIAVNLSARQFYEPNLVEMIADILQETQLDPSSLELEITESTAIKNIDVTQGILAQIQAMGVRIAMDDFGTGYSSLNYLTQLPLDTLKIDRAFIQNLWSEAKELEIIHAVIALGRALDLTVIAEGIDNTEQLDLLRSLNCPIVQGYLTGRPSPANELRGVLQANWQQHCPSAEVELALQTFS